MILLLLLSVSTLATVTLCGGEGLRRVQVNICIPSTFPSVMQGGLVYDERQDGGGGW